MFLLIIVLTTVILLILGVILFIKFFFTVLPQNTVLIVNNQKVYFANTITLPTDTKQLMQMEHVHVRTAYTDEQGVLCKEKLLLNMGISYHLCVDLTEESILKVAAKIGVANVGNSAIVTEKLSEALENNLKSLVADLPYEMLEKDRGKLRKALFAQLVNKLYGYKIEYIDIEQIELVSMDRLAKQNETLFNQQQKARDDWAAVQKKQLEKRLKLITEHQLDLSNKIKVMIANYQKVIREKINFFINRDLLK